jgi:very-short-patch-repair endonuclease
VGELPAEQWQSWWRTRLSDAQPLRTASQQGFVVTTSQLCGLGWTRSATRAAVRRGAWTAVGRGVVAPLCVDDDESSAWLATRRRHALAATGSVLVRADHVISGSSAAIVHGLPTLTVPDLVELTEAQTEVMGRRAPAHVFSARLAPQDVTRWFGAPVATVARTIVDQARHSRRNGLMAADAALRERLVTREQICGALAEAAGWPGVRRARQICELASPYSESALESVVRLALHGSGFPRPELQFRIGPYWTDFCWPAQRLVVEADGSGKYAAAGALQREKRREHHLHVRGWRVERVMWADVLYDWQLTCARLWRAFAASGTPYLARS